MQISTGIWLDVPPYRSIADSCSRQCAAWRVAKGPLGRRLATQADREGSTSTSEGRRPGFRSGLLWGVAQDTPARERRGGDIGDDSRWAARFMV